VKKLASNCRQQLLFSGDMELKTTTLENFRNQGKVEKNIRVNRDTLKLSGERVLKTTNHDYENFSEVESSDIRAVPSWFQEENPKQIIIS